MSPVKLDQLLESLDSSRRTFLKSLILGTAYATPAVTSFGMESVVPSDLSNLCSNLDTRDSGPGSTSDVVINKSASPDPVGPGEELTIEIRVYNCGPFSAARLVVTDQLPVGATFVSSSQSGNLTFDLDEPPVGTEGGLWTASTLEDLPVGEEMIFTIVLEVTP